MRVDGVRFVDGVCDDDAAGCSGEFEGEVVGEFCRVVEPRVEGEWWVCLAEVEGGEVVASVADDGDAESFEVFACCVDIEDVLTPLATTATGKRASACRSLEMSWVSRLSGSCCCWCGGLFVLAESGGGIGGGGRGVDASEAAGCEDMDAGVCASSTVAATVVEPVCFLWSRDAEVGGVEFGRVWFSEECAEEFVVHADDRGAFMTPTNAGCAPFAAAMVARDCASCLAADLGTPCVRMVDSSATLGGRLWPVLALVRAGVSDRCSVGTFSVRRG